MQASTVRVRTFTIRPPRNPLLRVLTFAASAVFAAGFLLLGLLAGAVALAGAAAWLLVRTWRTRGHHPPADRGVIEGEYTVVTRPRAALPRQD